jgi:hypothetical protein
MACNLELNNQIVIEFLTTYGYGLISTFTICTLHAMVNFNPKP